MSPQAAMGTETPVRHRILSRGGQGPRKLPHSSVMVGGCWAAADGRTCFLLGFWSEATAHVAAVHAETHSPPTPPNPPAVSTAASVYQVLRRRESRLGARWNPSESPSGEWGLSARDLEASCPADCLWTGTVRRKLTLSFDLQCKRPPF